MRQNVTLESIKRLRQLRLASSRTTKRRGSEKMAGRTVKKAEAA